MTMPPPIPVPSVNPMTYFAPRAAPRHHSPKIAQLASLSSVAGRLSPSLTRSRSGMFVQPRFGVRSTTPVLVLRGPGEPMPTPSIFLPDSAIDALASLMIRALRGHRRLGNDAMNLGAVLSEDSGDQIRSPDVNADDVAHQSPRRPRSRPQQ